MGEDKAVEASIIPFANAIVDPGAMMVEPVDADVAQVAVTAAGCLDYFTVGTDACCLVYVE